MKKYRYYIVLITSFLFSTMIFSQEKIDTVIFHEIEPYIENEDTIIDIHDNKLKSIITTLTKCSDNRVYIDASFGFATRYSIIKQNCSVNNLLLYKRLGFYFSVEEGVNGYNLFSNIWGATYTINDYAYLFGGVGVFTNSGVFNSKFMHVRKEIGIGITPYKWIVGRVGWSIAIGPTFSVGIRVPLNNRIQVDDI